MSVLVERDLHIVTALARMNRSGCSHPATVLFGIESTDMISSPLLNPEDLSEAWIQEFLSKERENDAVVSERRKMLK